MNKLGFKEAFLYPFNRFVGMFNILWILVPIIGWFALGGYKVRIVQGFARGEFKELPEFKFVDNLKLGFFMFFKIIPLVLFMIIVFWTIGAALWFVGAPEMLISLLVMIVSIIVFPMLIINFMVKETVASSFDFGLLKAVFENIWDYIFSIIKNILLAIVYLPLYLIIVWIPAASFTKNIFVADFYFRRINYSEEKVSEEKVSEEKIEDKQVEL